MNIVLGDVGKIVGAEIELRRLDTFAARALPSEIQVRGEVLGGKAAGQFHPVLFAIGIVERRQNDGGAKLSLINQVMRLLVIVIETDGQLLRDLLLNPDVVVI